VISAARSSHFPYLPVHVRLGNIQYPDHALDIEAFVDTGFDGSLILPQGLIPDRIPVIGETICHLADGSIFAAASYLGSVSVGSLAPVRAIIMTFPDKALLGRAVTEHFRLSFLYRRQVVLES